MSARRLSECFGERMLAFRGGIAVRASGPLIWVVVMEREGRRTGSMNGDMAATE
jgi:hypothetical protein